MTEPSSQAQDHPWWQALPGIEQGWVLFSDLLELLSTSGRVWRLDAVAGVAEPALAGIDFEFQPDQKTLAQRPKPPRPTDSPLGAFEIEGLTVIPIEDPNDGYRSLCHWLRVVPGLSLSHRLPRFAVSARVVPNGDTGRAEARPGDSWTEEDGGLMELVSKDSQEVLLVVGTNVDEYYYPSAVLRWEPEAMTRAFPQAEARLMREDMGSISVSARARQRL